MAELSDLNLRVQGLSQFCEQKLAPQVQAVELKFKVDFSAVKTHLLYCGPVVIVGCVLAKTQGPGKLSTIGFVAMMIAGALVLKEVGLILRQYSARAAELQKLKNEFKKTLVHFLEPSFSFEPHPTFPKDLFDSSGIFPASYDRGSAEGRVTGTLGKTKFDAMKVTASQKVTRKDSKGRSYTAYVPVYKGLLFQADFSKNFASKTTVRTDSSEKIVGGLARTAQRLKTAFSKSTLVELENPTFEASFQVHSTDAIEARYILTPAFMERVLALKAKRGVDIQLSFQNSRVIVGIPRSLDMGEPNFDLNNLSTSAEVMMTDIFSMLELIEDLDLNNRLSKAA